MFGGGVVEGGLSAEEELVGVGVGIEVDEDFGVGDGVVDAVGEGIAEGLEEMEGAFVAGGVAVVADEGEDGAVGAEGGDGDEVSEAGATFVGAVAEDDVINFCGVDVAKRVARVGDGGVGESGLRDVVAGEWIVRALKDGGVGVVVVGEVTDDFAVRAAAVVGVAEVVESVGAGRAVGVGRAVDINVHAMSEDREVVLRGRREALRADGKTEEEGEGEGQGAEGVRQARGGSFPRLDAAAAFGDEDVR
jgi:hypothetical protein